MGIESFYQDLTGLAVNRVSAGGKVQLKFQILHMRNPSFRFDYPLARKLIAWPRFQFCVLQPVMADGRHQLKHVTTVFAPQVSDPENGITSVLQPNVKQTTCAEKDAGGVVALAGRPGGLLSDGVALVDDVDGRRGRNCVQGGAHLRVSGC